MTALYLDGFDHYGLGSTGLANMLQGSWAQVAGGVGSSGPGVPVWGVRTGLFSLASSDQGGQPYRLVLPAAKTKIFMSHGFSVDGLPTGNFANAVVSFCTSANAVFAILWCQSDGSLVLTGSSTADVLAESQGPVVISRNWHFFEMEFDPTGGNFVLRVDDPTASNTPVINAAGISYTDATVGQLQFLDIVGGSGVTAWIDDLFVRDALGSNNNGFLGERSIGTLLADADTSVAGWTPRYYHNIGLGILNNTAFANSSTPNAAVTTPASNSLSLGAADFTLEGFVRFQALPVGTSKATIFSAWDANSNLRSYELFLGSVALNDRCICFQTSTDGTNGTVAQPIVFPWAPETETWYHVALVRASGEDLLFIDGQQQGLPIADTNAYFAVAATFGLGAEITGSGAFTNVVADTSLQGWLDEVRVTVGFARYTANFTPTTVAFPRNVGGDPEFADVALLAGFDSLIQDESSFARVLVSRNGAVQQTVNDGPSVGVFSTVGKQTPDDNTFAEAPFLPAISVLTLDAQPAVGNTASVGIATGNTTAVYTFEANLTAAYQVLIDTSLQQTLDNLVNAINAGPGGGTKYGNATSSNVSVNAAQLPAGQIQVTANTAGSAGNSIATVANLTNGGGWTGTTLAGGEDIPGPSEFQVQRPPPLTTIISAVQVTQRAFKSDAGACSVNTAFIGALGNATAASAHSPGITPAYFNDIYEEDPDTSGPISPATIINGRIRLNRAT